MRPGCFFCPKGLRIVDFNSSVAMDEFAGLAATDTAAWKEYIRTLRIYRMTFSYNLWESYLLLCLIFRTSARPFPAGGFPPKLQYSNAGHLGDCFSAEKYR